MHACMDACVRVCMHTCMFTWTFEHGRIYACANILMYVCPRMYAFPCMHVHMHACIHARIHACVDVLMCNFAGMPGTGVISAEYLVVISSTNLRMSFIDAGVHGNASSESEQ